ncbi:hypothetical protein [Specibacter cremeus]|uniref:hypothetical protein n=1 Tax=Specibacter cremeus TaxID=1629051 RepID=UPI000F767007|nr:hypothetical protein [Specibacter cremeus]
MLTMVIVTLVAGAFGAIAWGTDSRRLAYGAALPAGVAVVAALIVWMITTAVGLDKPASTAWIVWIVPMAVGVVAAWLTAQVVGRTRHAHDTEKVNEILRMR